MSSTCQMSLFRQSSLIYSIADPWACVYHRGSALAGALIARLLASSVPPTVACERKEGRCQEIANRFGVNHGRSGRGGRLWHCGPRCPIIGDSESLQIISGRLAHNPLIISLAAAIPTSLPVVRANSNSRSIVGVGGNPVVCGQRLSAAARTIADRFLVLLDDGPVVRDR